MTHITSREIAEGNLKSIMRMILALAAHYKPQSVREGSNRTFSGRNDGRQECNSTHVASSAKESQIKVVTHGRNSIYVLCYLQHGAVYNCSFFRDVQ